MDALLKKYKKIILLLAAIVGIGGVGASLHYLSEPEKTIAQLEGDNKYTMHQYVTESEVKERQEIEKDFTKKAEEVGSDTQKQKEITDEYKNNVNNFNKKVFFRNEERFKKYIEKLDLYFKQHPEVKVGEVFNQYANLTANVELKLFSQAASNLKNISKKLNLNILDL